MLQNWWFKKEKPLFTGLHFGFGAGGGAAGAGGPSPEPISATGGSKSTLPNGNITHEFDSSGSLVIASGRDDIQFLVIAGGGGGGGGYEAGGGGAGGYRSSMPDGPGGPSPSPENAVPVDGPMTIPIVIGAGGAGGAPSSPTNPYGVRGSNGVNSNFNHPTEPIVSQGGGGGGYSQVAADPGGSGGGMGYFPAPSPTLAPPTNSKGYGSRVTGSLTPAPNQGYNGGVRDPGPVLPHGPYYCGSGGGGAGQLGGSNTNNDTDTVYGGAGKADGIPTGGTFRGGGGGGGNYGKADGGEGGTGGGGEGSGMTPVNGVSGTDYTGGGGGGSGDNPGSGGNGGAGKIILMSTG